MSNFTFENIYRALERGCFEFIDEINIYYTLDSSKNCTTYKWHSSGGKKGTIYRYKDEKISAYKLAEYLCYNFDIVSIKEGYKKNKFYGIFEESKLTNFDRYINIKISDIIT